MSKKIKISATTVKKISNPESGQDFYWDTVLQGFGLRVGAKKKSYIAQKKINGKDVRVTLGIHGQITAEIARDLAMEKLAEMTKGENPTDKKREAKAKGVTLGEAFKDFLRDRKELKPRTISDYEWTMDYYFSNWLKKPLINIDKDKVSRRHAKIRQDMIDRKKEKKKSVPENTGKAQANQAMRVLRSIFNYARDEYEDSKGKSVIGDNPVQKLSKAKKWYGVNRRQTVIKTHQLPALFDALDKLEDTAVTTKAETVRDYILFLLFTGLRRQEAARLKWESVDFKDRSFVITDTKNKKPLSLPLSDFVYDLLKERYENKANGYVFAGNGAGGYLVEPKRQVNKVRKESGLTFTLHDQRRTFITIAESLDVPHYAIKMLVNHSMGSDVTGGYIVSDVERLRAPMQKITDKILFEAGRRGQAKVIDFKKVRG